MLKQFFQAPHFGCEAPYFLELSLKSLRVPNLIREAELAFRFDDEELNGLAVFGRKKEVVGN